MQLVANGRNPVAKKASEEILRQGATLAEALVKREDARRPDRARLQGSKNRDAALRNAGDHWSYLAEAVGLESPGLFADYIGWAKVLLAARGIDTDELASQLKSILAILGETFPAELRKQMARVVEYGLQRLPGLPCHLHSFMEPIHPYALLAHQYLQVLLRGERHVASKLILEAVQRGVPVKDIYLHVFQRSQYEIGRLWQSNEISVAQEHYCTAATQLIMSQLYPHIFAGEKNRRTFVGTCVSGDLHEIGGRMIADFFEMAGWHAYYLGAYTPANSVIDTLIAHKADVLGISATITYHVHAVEELISRIRTESACAGVKILVGGYPFNCEPELWRSIGCAQDADSVIALAEQLIGRRATPCY